MIAAIRRSATATPSRTPTATRLTISAHALAALEADTVLCEAMGPDLVKAFLTIRKDELAKWEAADGTWDLETISPWELEQYLPFF